MKYRLKKRSEIKKRIEDLKESNLLFIHYSCESFYDIIDGHTPRITSIAVRFGMTKTTKSFSIHKVAEKQGILLEKIKEKYDIYEKKCLMNFLNLWKNIEDIHGFIGI